MREPNLATAASPVRRLTVAAYTVFLTAVSLWPKPPELSNQLQIPNADKLVHSLLYAAYAWLMLWASRRDRSLGFAAAIVVYGTAFGALMEVLQAAIGGPNRNGTIGDGAANAIGSLIGAGVFLWARSRRAAG